ncbi:DIE2/ALG10 family-domain-containing protein [Amylostereum chailletii]|nr:DIE2/ALG10 family-domain-containing protein [Amylostereum chailletii]
MSSPGATAYVIFTALSVVTLKELNAEVTEPYMDEPFHVPQVQAYCNGDWSYWDPKITTPPGLYVYTMILKTLFLFKCKLPTLRLAPLLTLLLLPFALTRLICFHKRIRTPPSAFTPTLDAVVAAAFPISWFFGLLYYTEVPGLLSVVLTIAAATQGNHWLAGLLGLVSCTFRQTNVVWVLYAYAVSQLMYLRFRRPAPNEAPLAKLFDPPALSAAPSDILRLIASAPKVLPDILPAFLPYAGKGGAHKLFKEVMARMFATRGRVLVTLVLSAVMVATVKLFTIHHPFLLSDNRHYTFYVWRRIFMLHPIVPYLFIPGYIACAWAWFLRVGEEQTLLQTLLLPVCTLPILLPTPLLEPRYFLVPYILMRSQVEMPTWALLTEGGWYAAINAVTMWVFLNMEREGVGRFMW